MDKNKLKHTEYKNNTMDKNKLKHTYKVQKQYNGQK